MTGEGRMDQSNNDGSQDSAALVTLVPKPERHLIRRSGSYRHIDFQVFVGEPVHKTQDQRPPINLAIVLDRSGSMSGEKLAMAKQATLAVLDRLEERDRIAVVVFDDRIDVVQPASPANAEVKEQIRRSLGRIEARANTALHEGWLTGCRAIAADTPGAGRGLAHCFLLTDGLANCGITDPEQIAGDAAGVLENAGINTITFGVGPDYNESLLGPMATAGGGQFHHLRRPADIVSTFTGELGELFSVAASKVRLELDGGKDITAEVVSEYWASQPRPGVSRVSITIGDLPAKEQRHVVVRFGFPPQGDLAERTILARVIWSSDGREFSGPWQETRFSYADHHACNVERRDAEVMHWVGLHHAERAKREATELNRRGDLMGAKERLKKVARRIDEYAGQDRDLQFAIQELSQLAEELSARRMAAMAAKELYYRSMTRSRGQKDFR